MKPAGFDDFVTLLEFTKNTPQQRKKVVGLILDCSAPYKPQQKHNYIIKMKIIDESLNFATPEDTCQDKKFITIFCYVDKLEDAMRCNVLGHIIYLKRFNFKRFQDKDIQGVPHQKAHSGHYLFDGNIDKNDFEVLHSNTDEAYEANVYVKQRVLELRRFSREFFSQYITKMNWFGKTELELTDNLTERQKDFDMVLKIASINREESQVCIKFVDGQGMAFTFSYSEIPINFYPHHWKIDDIVRVRSVCAINTKFEIISNDYTNLMLIPQHFFDFQNFETLFRYNIIDQDASTTKHDQEMIIENQEIVNQHSKQSIQEAVQTSNKIVNVLNWQLLNKPEQEFVQLRELLDLQEKYLLHQSKLPSLQFRVCCYVLHISPSILSDALLYTCLACKRRLKAHLNVTLLLKDESIDTQQTFLKAQVYSLDGKGENLLLPGDSNLTQSLQNKQNLQTLSDQFSERGKKLFMHSTLLKPLILKLQAVPINQDNLYFRVIEYEDD